MSGKPSVLRSVNDQGAQRCVDLFLRSDGTYGFEEYRRDPEDPRGWFPVGGHASLVFDSEDAAWRAADATVVWLTSG